MNSIKVGIIGATGYAGQELFRLLLGHPRVKIAAVSSISFTGQSISEVYPSLYQIRDDILTTEDQVIGASDLIFASLPHGLSEPLAKKILAQGKILIDLGADFRLASEQDYKQWYGLDYDDKQIRRLSCYCIPELHRTCVTKEIRVIGNPGCYPTSIALAAAPALKAGLVKHTGIVIDAKSGVTGAGRGLTQTTHFPECNEGFCAYKVAEHRHTPEIEQTLSACCSEQVTVTFVPHLLPINRGILSTVYLPLEPSVSGEHIYQEYVRFYQNERFIRVLPQGHTANLKHVKYSNYCDISLHVDERTQTLIVVSVIDNMGKGAAGQAIQNMNLVSGFAEDTGLAMLPPAF